MFAVTENEVFDYYLNTGNGTTFSYGIQNAPVAFDNFKAQLDLAYNEAVAQGYTVQDRIAINWLQGQSDTSNTDPDYGYGYLLDRMFNEIDQYADSVFGNDIETISIVSQHRGYSKKEIAIEQIDYIVENSSAYFGAPEFQLQASEPSLIGTDYTHLSSEGYFVLGNTIGLKLYDALEGTGDDPIVISDVQLVTPSEVLVTFSGVEGQLVDDPDTAYRTGSGLVAPENYGFGTTNALGFSSSVVPSVISAQIENTNQVRLFFDEAIEDEFRLYLGRNDNEDLGDPLYSPSAGLSFGGSTLRDSETHTAATPTSGRILDDDLIYEYAPVQYVSIDPDDFI